MFDVICVTKLFATSMAVEKQFYMSQTSWYLTIGSISMAKKRVIKRRKKGKSRKYFTKDPVAYIF